MIFFKINSKSLSKNPTEMTFSNSPIQSTDRTIDGTMVVDIIAVKNVVTVEWAVLDKEDMAKLLNELGKGGFVTIDYYEAKSNSIKNITALPSNISYSPFYDYSSDSIIWKNIKITFTEQ